MHLCPGLYIVKFEGITNDRTVVGVFCKPNNRLFVIAPKWTKPYRFKNLKPFINSIEPYSFACHCSVPELEIDIGLYSLRLKSGISEPAIIYLNKKDKLRVALPSRGRTYKFENIKPFVTSYWKS